MYSSSLLKIAPLNHSISIEHAHSEMTTIVMREISFEETQRRN
jgi:hypothetical protein